MEGEKEYKQLYLFACARGLIPDVEGFLEKGVSPGVQDKEKRSGAHFAAYHGELEMLKFLHSKGVDIDSEDVTGRSPLHYAALRDHESTVAFLESKGAWVDACDATDSCPLHLAARAGAPAAASRLLKLGAKSIIKNQWNLTPLGEAVVHGHVKVCTAILSAAGDAGADMLAQKATGGLSLLHLAAGAGKADTVGWLLDKKVAVNDSSNDEGLAPLHCCVLGGRVCQATVDKLISFGADCGARDAKGNTPVECLERPEATPGLADRLADLSQDMLHSVKKKMESKASSTTSRATKENCKASGATAATHSTQPAAADAPVVGARGAGALSAAARLQAATSAQDVVQVFNSMSESDRVHRVKVWARLPAGKLEEVPGLTSDIKERLGQVHEAMCAAERAHTEEMLRKDLQFQEDMATPAVRSVVDAVVADPAMGPYVTGRAQLCLTKLRQLRDILKARGDGRIHLDRLLEPWTPAVGEHVHGLEMEADSLIRDTVTRLCHGTGQLDSNEGGGAATTMDTHGKLATPKELGEGQTKGQSQEELEKPSLWKNAGQRLLAQLAVAALLIALLWWRQELPYQRKAREAAKLAFETDSYDSLEL